jgi:hypothetical protein
VSSPLSLPLLERLSLKLGQVSNLLTRNITDITEVDRGHEARRLPSLGNLGVELVDLLQGQTLSLVDEEVDENETDATEATPDEEHLSLEVGVAGAGVDHVGGGVGDGPVQEPVGGGGDGETLGTGLEGEEFTGDDPGDGAPGAGEEEDVDADEGDQGLVGDCVAGEGGADTGDDQLADGHADGTEHEQVATTPLLDHPETGEGGADVDDVGDQGDGEAVGDTGVLEEGGAVVDWVRLAICFPCEWKLGGMIVQMKLTPASC